MNYLKHVAPEEDYARIKPEKSFSVTKEKLTLRPDMSIDNTGRVKGENSTGPAVSSEIPFGAFNKGATDAEKAEYNTTDPKQRKNKPVW